MTVRYPGAIGSFELKALSFEAEATSLERPPLGRPDRDTDSEPQPIASQPSVELRARSIPPPERGSLLTARARTLRAGARHASRDLATALRRRSSLIVHGPRLRATCSQSCVFHVSPRQPVAGVERFPALFRPPRACAPPLAGVAWIPPGAAFSSRSFLGCEVSNANARVGDDRGHTLVEGNRPGRRARAVGGRPGTRRRRRW